MIELSPEEIEKLPYRDCAGIMMLNDSKQVFVARRIDTTSEAWQMPQGGIDGGEDVKETALRELKEEIGTDNVEVLAESKDWYFYDLPKEIVGKIWKGRYRGQRQKWFVVRFLGADAEINIETEHPEFNEWKWIDAQDMPDIIVPFKKKLYEDLIEEFKDIISGGKK